MATRTTTDLRPDRFQDATAVLYLTSPVGDDGPCVHMLGADAARPVDLLQVTYQRPESLIEEWRAHGRRSPANARVVAVGPASAAVSSSDRGVHTVETVAAPSDLTGIGIEVSRAIDDWKGDGNPTVVCFDSITYLLEYVGMERAYEFLHVLTRRLDAEGAVSHFHLSPGAHDDQTVEGVKSLFDAVVDETGDRPIEVQTA